MKILWIVNMVLPDIAQKLNINTSLSGSWMEDLSKEVSRNEKIELAVAAIHGTEFKDITIGSIRYFLIPGNGKTMLFYSKKNEMYWGKIYNLFKPDIVHLHGTEYSHGLAFLRVFPNVKSVVSVQGILTRIKDIYLEGIPKLSCLKYRTLRENIKFNGMLETRFLHKRNSMYEQEIIKRVKYANTVNFWDTSLIESINSNIKCFQIEYNLRDVFYNSPKWNLDRIKRFSIFTNPGNSPLKGLHILIKALSLVKISYPNVKLFVPGFSQKNGEIVITSGYSKYIESLIKKYKLTDNIEFLGGLTAEQMVDQMLKANLVVIPSAIEGTSLVLREAMYLGVPSIAAFRGGMADFIRDKESGFLYDFQEFPYLANRIKQLFENDELSLIFSKNAISLAEKAHNREDNPRNYFDMYNYIYLNE